MHIHGAIPGIQNAGFYGISNGERAAAARRAADTRKRLLRAGDEGPEDLSADETALVGRWMDARQGEAEGQGQSNEDEYRPSGSGRDADFG